VTPKVAKRGGSFKGAAAYYLHDKGADTDDRVAFCTTRNLPVDEPELAWRWMAYTAKHAGILKHDAGVAKSGTRMSKPVYTLSLSWHPDDKPAPDFMVRMMDTALAKIGLSNCQTLLVAHNDTEHPHIHAIVNLVDPDTGKIVKTGRDYEKLSRWALAYEKEQGTIRCQQRVENMERRDRGEWVRDTASLTRQDIEQARLIEKQILAGRRQELWQAQLGEREALKQEAQQKAEAMRAALKERYRPLWAAHYKKQRQDARDVANAKRSVLAAMRVAIKERRRLAPDGRAGIGTILAYSVSAKALGDALREAGERESAALRQRMNDHRRRMVKAVWEDYGREFAALRQTQAKARKAAPAREVAEDARQRAALEAALEKRRARETPPTREPEPKQQQPPEAMREAESKRQREEAARRERQQPARRGPVRLELPEIGDPTEPPPLDEKARRREELKAEFRRQAEEIARRRKERGRKDRDRDRER
jgi:hypothetical protein